MILVVAFLPGFWHPLLISGWQGLAGFRGAQNNPYEATWPDQKTPTYLPTHWVVLTQLSQPYILKDGVAGVQTKREPKRASERPKSIWGGKFFWQCKILTYIPLWNTLLVGIWTGWKIFQWSWKYKNHLWTKITTKVWRGGGVMDNGLNLLPFKLPGPLNGKSVPNPGAKDSPFQQSFPISCASFPSSQKNEREKYLGNFTPSIFFRCYFKEG